jgi:fructosamine-3-kinase
MSRLPEAVVEFIAAQGWGGVAATTPVGGGCINDGMRVDTSGGPALFLKQNRSTPRDMFRREAEGLEALGAADGGPRAPTPLLVGDDFILLEYLAPTPPAADYWEAFGAQLARLHLATSPQFGFAHDNYIGSTPQPNRWEEDGFKFFAEHRLLFQGRLARERGLLSPSNLQRLERLASRLRELAPDQPASLIHGDLWGGNVIPGPAPSTSLRAGGRACMIDPAAHYGWAEAELAMTALFGQFPSAFYSAYESVRPLAPSWRSRFDLYNLYHLLNHLNLFGRSYLSSVEGALAQYS